MLAHDVDSAVLFDGGGSTTLAGRTATISDSKVASGSATAGAIPAQYSLQVQNLATAASLASQPVSSGTTVVGTGTLTIAVGGSSASISIDSTNNTLAGIAAAINSAPNNPGVSATILTTSAGARLVLTGNTTGAANAITVTQSGGDGGLAALTYDPTHGVTNLTQTQAATDANFSVNGFAATSPGNQVTSVISGVTLNLAGTTAANTPATLTIGNDTTGAQTSIGTFVTALNGLITSIQSLTGYDPSTKTAGPLLGNATLQSFQSQLSKILDQVQSGTAGTGTSLASLGITANTQGTYNTNTTTLGNALTANLTPVGNFFGGLTFTVRSGMGIASGSGSISRGCDFDKPFDSFARTFSFGASVAGNGMAALLTSVAFMALSPDCDPPQLPPVAPLYAAKNKIALNKPMCRMVEATIGPRHDS